MIKKIFIFIFLIQYFFAFNISGEIYSGNNFENLNNVVIKIHGDSNLKFLTSNHYSIQLEKGNYIIEAFYYENGKLSLYSYDEINVNKDTVFDLILFYPEEFEILNNEEYEINYNGKTNNLIYYLFLFFLLLIIILLFKNYFKFKKREEKIEEFKEDQESEKNKNSEIILDEDAKLVLKILSENDNRLEQKELRNILGWSETRTSLVISELESYNYLKRIKKGRKNLIKLYQTNVGSSSSKESE